jgi:hypothetical protein
MYDCAGVVECGLGAQIPTHCNRRRAYSWRSAWITPCFSSAWNCLSKASVSRPHSRHTPWALPIPLTRPASNYPRHAQRRRDDHCTRRFFRRPGARVPPAQRKDQCRERHQQRFAQKLHDLLAPRLAPMTLRNEISRARKVARTVAKLALGSFDITIA